MSDLFAAVLLGIVEGLTEFIPVSSTGHLLLTQRLLGLTDARWASFVVVIQLGAILAVVALYFRRLWGVLIALPTRADARRFALAVAIAFLPAGVVGLALYSVITTVLFESMTLICVSLITGGFVLLFLDRRAASLAAVETDAMALSWRKALGIGLFQCLAIVPGVSRSGATIGGALLLGLNRRAAAEFSFFLAIPTMVAASSWDLIQSGAGIDIRFAGLIAVGFCTAFVVGGLVVRVLVSFVSRHGFAPFAWWRIGAGSLGLFLIWSGFPGRCTPL